jgi:RimJ/RimL family protein N-acetyltransferase
MNFKTERLAVRPFLEGDKEKMLEMLYNESIKKTYMIPDFESIEAAEKLFSAFLRLSNAPDRYVGAICLDDELIGFMNDTEIVGDTVEMGYVISPKHQNKGYCTEAMTGAIEHLFERGFRKVKCGAFEENEASIRVMQKCGMKLLSETDIIEYRGQVHNCVYYSKIKK